MKKQTILLLACSLLLAGCGENNSSSGSTGSSDAPISSDVVVSGITLNETAKTLQIGESFQIVPTITPANATNKLVNYSSSNENIASVSLTGLVTAKGKGTTTITATSDSNPNIKASITIEVAAKNITSFDVAFPSSIEETIISGTTYKQLITGTSYVLTPSFVGSDVTTLEASFSTPGFASFNSETNTLIAEKEITKLEISFSAKGTSLSPKKYTFRILSQGKADQAIAFAKLQKSAEEEAKKTVNGYSFEFSNDGYTSGVNTKERQVTDTTLYKEGQHSYMVGKKTVTKKVGSDAQTQTNITTFKGIGQDNNYYELEINDLTHKHEKTPVKKAIVTSDSANAGQITRADALKKGTLLEHNSHFGLSNVAAAMVDPNNSGYDYFVNNKSYPHYFGGDVAKNAVYETTSTGFKVNGHIVEETPAGDYRDGMVFYNEGTFVFGSGNVLTSVTVVNKVYDKTGFDFENNALLPDATPINTYTIKYSQMFGEIENEEEVEGHYAIDVNDLYFTSYEIDLLLGKNIVENNKLEVNQTYSFAEKKQNPNIATSIIDPILLTDVSDKSVVSILDGGLSFKILKEGSANLTFYSTEHSKSFSLSVSTVLPEATGITIKRGSSGETIYSSTTINAITGQSLEDFYFVTTPASSAQTDTNPTFVFTNESGQDASDVCSFTKTSKKINNHPSYSFSSTKAGTYTVIAKYSERVTASFKVIVTDPASGAISDAVIQNDFTIDDGDNQLTLRFNSKTSGKINGYTLMSEPKKTSFIENDTSSQLVVSVAFTCSFDDSKGTLTFLTIDVNTGDLSYFLDDYYGFMPTLNSEFSINDAGTELTGSISYSDDTDTGTFIAFAK